MEGLCRVAGSGVPFRFGERIELLYPLRLRDWGVIENFVLTRGVLDGFDLLRWFREENVLQDRKDDKQRSGVRVEHIQHFIDTAIGTAMTLWLMRRSGEFGSAVLEVTKFRDRVPEFHRIRNMISGADYLSQTEWPIDVIKEAFGEENEEATPWNWKGVFRGLCEHRFPGLSPEQVGEMTLFEYNAAACDAATIDGKFEMNRLELSKWNRAKKQLMEQGRIPQAS